MKKLSDRMNSRATAFTLTLYGYLLLIMSTFSFSGSTSIFFKIAFTLIGSGFLILGLKLYSIFIGKFVNTILLIISISCIVGGIFLVCYLLLS